jgi:phosphoribosyl-ATP pyrophosphohydrolase
MKSFKLLSKLSDADETNIFKRLTKLGEEYGEFCSAALEEDGFKVSKKNLSEKALREHILEEGVDTIMMCFDILRHKGFSMDEIEDMMEDKLQVWESILIGKGLIESVVEDPKSHMIQNAMKCLECGKIIQSRYTHDYEKCGCANGVMVDGGLDYQRYSFADKTKIESYTINSSDSFEYTKSKLLWGTYGKNNDQPLKYVPLIDCETEHLQAILKNMYNIRQIHKTVIISILKDRGVYGE